MNRTVIWIISICMGLAMISLIFVQGYWLKNAWLVKEKQFDQLIHWSMMDISRELEQKEASRLIMQQIDPLSTDTGAFIWSRNLNGQKNITGSGRPLGRMGVNIDRDNKKQWESYLKDRRAFIDRVISGMLFASPEIEKRISAQDVEQIIQKVFHENDIDLRYEYGVTRYNGQIAFQSTGYNPATEAMKYNVQLFPEDVYANANFLSVYFPQKRNFLFNSLSYLMGSALFLTMALVVIFVLTIVILFRQKRVSEIRNDFVSNMTHELKTPISTISLASQMLGDKSIPSEIKNTDQIAKIITEECKRLGSQVEKVLQTSVFDKGRLKLRLTEVDMHEVISSVLENFTILVRNRDGRISSSLRATESMIQADQVHITNVLSNLLDNAIKYCNREPEIRVETANKGGFLMILIADNGIGISKGDQKRVFEKFYRVPTGNVHSVKGFGLGLSYVKMIIEEHQGYIDLESELYEGSTFTLYLPVKENGNHTKDQDSAG